MYPNAMTPALNHDGERALFETHPESPRRACPTRNPSPVVNPENLRGAVRLDLSLGTVKNVGPRAFFLHETSSGGGDPAGTIGRTFGAMYASDFIIDRPSRILIFS